MSKSSTITKVVSRSAVATPDRVTTHPGEVLAEEFLKPLGRSVNALAMALRVPATRVAAIVKGERAVTADTALRLARFFGMSPEFWVNMQAMHDLTKARQENGAMIARDVHVATKTHRGVEYSIRELVPGHGRWEWKLWAPEADGTTTESTARTSGEVQGTWGAAEALAKRAINKWLAETGKGRQSYFTDT
jgi:antitoxin HigA-1